VSIVWARSKPFDGLGQGDLTADDALLDEDGLVAAACGI
jgi:hypothetical protein